MTYIENSKKKSLDTGDTPPKKDKAASKDPLMKTAFIRVSKVNMTGENKDIPVTFSEDTIKNILDEWAWTSSMEYWFIDHIPDDEDTNDHFHIVIKFKTNSHFSTIKNKFPYGKIETAKNIRRAIQYLVHLNNPEKLQYTWDKVITNCLDLSQYKVLSRSQQEINLQRILEKIEKGEITAFNYTKSIPIDIFAKNKTAIKNAIEFTTDRIISDPNRPLTVMYFYGKTGIGKTSFAKKICTETYPDESPCISSSGNDPLQDYKGQKALIWDDFRDSQFKFSDLLKFLDPFTRSSGKSRYINKHFLGNLIILTSTQGLDFLYKGCDNNTEDMKQLRRRISYYYEFVEDKIRIYIYAGNNQFREFKTHINPFYGMESKPLTELKFDTAVYERMGIKLEDPICNPPGYLHKEVPAPVNPVSGCEIIQVNGSRTAHHSLTQMKI